MLLLMDHEKYDNDPIDWMGCERDIDMIIFNPATTANWLGREINIIDFFSVWESHTMRVIDGGVTLLSATSEIQPLMIKSRKAQIKHNIPSVIFVGEIEKKGADFFALVQQIGDRLPTVPLVMQLPINEGEEFVGLVDLIGMKELIWEKIFDDDCFSSYYIDKPTEHEIRKELISQAIAYRHKIIEQIAEVDGNENIMEKFLENKHISQEEMVEAIRVATISMAVTPIFIGCLSRNKGLKKLLDAVVDYLPAPSVDIEAENMDNHENLTLYVKENEPFVGMVFAVYTDPFLGELSVVCVYRGSLTLGSHVYNSTQNKKEKINQMFKMYATKREETSKFFAGEIAHVVGLKAKIGDILCDPSHKVMLKKPKILEPSLFVKVVVREKSSQEGTIEYAFRKLSRENSLCMISYGESLYDPILIYGDSKLWLKKAVHRLKDEFKLDIVSNKPQIIYYQTIKTTFEKEYIYQKAPTSHSQETFDHLCLKLEPQERGEGYRFVDEIKGGVIPKEFIYSINQ